MAEQVVYRHTIEGLFRSIGRRLTPRLKEQLKQAGLDLDAPIPRNTPRLVFAEALRITARALYPDVDLDEGYRRLGAGLIQGVEQTLLGKALVAMWPIFGPERVVVRIQESFATVNNYLRTELETQGRAHHVLRVSECNGNPGYLRGIIEAGLAKAGAKNLRVEPFDFDGHACSYRIQWDP
ncbi:MULTISPECIES: DUF2378 family protein [unclassified Corallococcus]|uniref:DUF2378 family protein n=1 Tax=unclassified Corallococcus TaxID=2685029 RepID=UPI001A908977|nr:MULTISPECIES: DUF2378 family protein [unclassified Corallococcus]MBN9684151.1 DUF2378 family protein [Corallococcus sp. NCSPR001]WAS84359.1 DUF2378 family protein [Corallococcus sp. NCRR]